MSKQVTKEWSNIDYSNTAAYRTIQAWKAEGVTQIHKLESLHEYGQLERLRKLDSILKQDKGIERVITTLTRQSVRQKDKLNRTISKEVLVIGGEFQGYSYYDEPYAMSFIEGEFRKPRMVKIYRGRQRIDPENGDDLGIWEASGSIIQYTIEVPRDAAKRKKLIDDIISNSQGDPEDIHFYYRDNIMGARDDTFSREQFTELSIDELRNLSKKTGGVKAPGYWRDIEGKLRNKDGTLA